jgi:hypothetical protein
MPTKPLLQNRLYPRHPPVWFGDLALMLEIDLLLGHKQDFRKRLRIALCATATCKAESRQRKVKKIRNRYVCYSFLISLCF